MKSSAQKLTAKYGFQPSTGFDSTVAGEGSYLTNEWHLGSLFSLKQFEIESSKAKLDNMNQPKHKSIYIFMRCNIGRNLYFQLWNGTIELPGLCTSWTRHSLSFQDWKHGRRKVPFSWLLLSIPTSNLGCLLLSLYNWNILSSSNRCSYRSNQFLLIFTLTEKIFFCWCCFYSQQLPINVSFIAITCKAKIFMHIGLVDYQQSLKKNLFNSVLHWKGQTWNHGDIWKKTPIFMVFPDSDCSE